MASFARQYGVIYSKSERELYAYFEIGCFLSLVAYYRGLGWKGEAQQLVNGEYRYHTSPMGNPRNFSYVKMSRGDDVFEIRQQIRIRSFLDNDIEFTPDIVVVKDGVDILNSRCGEYANGKRSYYSVCSKDVIAVHECKKYKPYPELLVSFVGFVVSYRLSCFPVNSHVGSPSAKIFHPAPILFTAIKASAFNVRMINALQKQFPLNIIDEMYSGRVNIKQKAYQYISA